MARIEKTVFISYRRKDISWALAVYQYLTSQKYDVFFDYKSIPSGDFEQIIVSNIRARAHFLLILTPTALDRCSEPGDWLRREIETALDEKRNIIPLFLDGFDFGLPSVAEKLSGKLGAIRRYNGLDIPPGYFMEAMERLRQRYLNVPLDAVIHPIPTEVRQVVKNQQVAADKALIQNREDIRELVKPAKEKVSPPEKDQKIKLGPFTLGQGKSFNLRLYAITAGILLLIVAGLVSVKALLSNNPGTVPLTMTSQFAQTMMGAESSLTAPANTATAKPQTSTLTEEPTLAVTSSPTLGVSSTAVADRDAMMLLYIPAGEFTMGNPAQEALEDCKKRGMTRNCELDFFKDEAPPHRVYLDAFWIDKTEITNAMFTEFLNQQGNQSEGGITWLRSGSSKVRIHSDGNLWQADAGYESHPVIEVSWYGASAYCSWAGRDLPTEAEWEKAASWDEEKQIKNVYPWGDEIDCSYANFNSGSRQCEGKTVAVGSYPKGKNYYGVYDMAGNVWEWVYDWYKPDYYATLVDSFPNPRGPSDGESRVLRGGSWYSFDYDVRSSRRESSNPALSSDKIGFRCALSE